jgi:cytochrome c oxidase subunit 2
MYKILLAALFSALVLSPGSRAGEQAPAAYQACVACHGEAGEGNPALKAPALAGQGAAYLSRQLINYRTGRRGANPGDTEGGQMRAMADSLTGDGEVTQVSLYLAALPATAVDEPAAGDLRNGESQYHGACGACHGGAAQGNPALNAPRLSNLDTAYLRRQMENFQDGIRGDHPDDRYGRRRGFQARGHLPTRL